VTEIRIGTGEKDEMTGWWSQNNDLIIGALFFTGAVTSTLTGKTLARPGRIIYRAKDPSDFWWVVATYYFVALFFVCLYLSGGQ
jgi:hypothetical protein